MPEATFLQIQGREGTMTRMLELPPGPIRIGRGPLCEVRLADPDLGDVHCMLRRRGGTWHFQPVGPPGQVWFDGRPADGQRPVRSGVPFRVGTHWLTLRSAESAVNDWGSFEAPITVEPEPDPATVTVTVTETPIPAAPEPVATDQSNGNDEPCSTAPSPDGNGNGGNDDRLRRWQARLDQRERWLKDRQDERRWEARWKAAGETIRARSTTPQPPPASPPVSRPTTPPAPPPRMPQAPPIARIIEPRPAEPFRRAAEPPRRPSAPRVPIRTGPEPPLVSPIGRVATKPTRTPEPLASSPPPTTRALVALPAPPPVETLAPEIEPVPEIASSLPPALDQPEARTVEVEVEPEPEPVIVDVPEAVVAEPPTPEESPASVMATEPEPATVVPIGEDLGSVKAATPHEAGWPSARAIFAAQGRRSERAPESSPSPSRPQGRRRRAVAPEPTAALAPCCWTLPVWLALVPVAAVVLALGGVGIALTREWVMDANAAEVAIRLALRPDGATAPPIDPASLPRSEWWRSTAPHLAAWAVALERSGGDEDRSGEIRALVEAARHASPLSASTRFVLEPTAPSEPGAPPDLSYLGRSRDVVSLVWTGRRLRKEGKTEASSRAYRSALEIAVRAGRDDLDPPAFDEDPQVRRYALPRESLLGWVVRDMAQAKWTHEQWVEALPPSAAASMAAARVLARKHDRAQADRLADLAIRQGEAGPPVGFDPGEHRAGVAEALAYRSRWTDAAEQYRLAIDLAEDDATRRRWWLNLAEVAQRTGDDTLRTRALEAAKAPDSGSGDEITKRAVRYQQGLSASAPRR